MELTTLYKTLTEQEAVKEDFIAPASGLQFINGVLHVGSREYKPSEVFHEQVSEKLNIPKGYYDRMRTKAITLLDDNVNHWLEKSGKRYLLRTFTGDEPSARALLSDKHHLLDNYLVVLETLKAIDDVGKREGIKIDGKLSESKMYLEVTYPDILVEAPELLRLYRRSITAGTGIIAGFLLQNSEVGKGAFWLIPRAVILACNNGAVNIKQALKKIHLGARLDDGLDMSGVKAVREANIRLIREQIRYAIQTFLTKEYVEGLVKYYTHIATPEIAAPVNKLTQVIAENFGWNEQSAEALLMKFVAGGDTRRIGIYNAMTDVAQTFDTDGKYVAEAAAWNVLQSFESFEKQAFNRIYSN